MPFQQGTLPGLRQVAGDHFLAHLLRGDFGHPTETFARQRGVAQQRFDLGGAKVARVHPDDGAAVPEAHFVGALPLPHQVHAELGGRPFDELAHAVLLAGGNDEVLRLRLLQHEPLHAHVVLGVAPVAQGVEVAHVEAVFQALADVGQAARDLAGDEGFAAARAFVVEQDAVTGVQAIGLAVVDGDPVGVELGHAVGAARVEGGGFALRGFAHQAIELAGTGLVEAGLALQAQDANGLQQAQGAQGVDVGGVFRRLENHGHVALRAEVVDLVGLGFLHDADQIAGVGEVAVVQLEAGVFDVRVLVDVVHPLGVEQAGAALDAVHDIAFFEQEFGQVAAVLAGDAGDQGDLGGGGCVHAGCAGAAWCLRKSA